MASTFKDEFVAAMMGWRNYSWWFAFIVSKRRNSRDGRM